MSVLVMHYYTQHPVLYWLLHTLFLVIVRFTTKLCVAVSSASSGAIPIAAGFFVVFVFVWIICILVQ